MCTFSVRTHTYSWQAGRFPDSFTLWDDSVEQFTASLALGPSSNPSGAARVLIVTNSATVSSITIDVNTTGFTAFNFPVLLHLQVVHRQQYVCQQALALFLYNGRATIPHRLQERCFLDAFDNHYQYIMNIGPNAVGIASAAMQGFAFKADFDNGITNAIT